MASCGFTENAVRRGEGDPAAQSARLNRIEQQLDRQRVPLAYAADFYNLRSHIRMVHEQLQAALKHRGVAVAAPVPGAPGTQAEQS